MAASHPEEVKEEARVMLEDEGCTLAETARRMGLAKGIIHGWAKDRKWVIPDVIRQVRVQEQKIVVDPVLDQLVKRMEGMPRSQREVEYDEAMHRFACSVPMILKQLSPQDIVTKADKVAKLVEMSRNVLNRNETKRASPLISLGILSAGQLPERRAEVLELPEQ
jgi:hypothetical protein